MIAISVRNNFPTAATIARPPSQVDDHRYYAIADYPPPAYDEITERRGSSTSSEHVQFTVGDGGGAAVRYVRPSRRQRGRRQDRQNRRQNDRQNRSEDERQNSRSQNESQDCRIQNEIENEEEREDKTAAENSQSPQAQHYEQVGNAANSDNVYDSIEDNTVNDEYEDVTDANNTPSADSNSSTEKEITGEPNNSEETEGSAAVNENSSADENNSNDEAGKQNERSSSQEKDVVQDDEMPGTSGLSPRHVVISPISSRASPSSLPDIDSDSSYTSIQGSTSPAYSPRPDTPQSGPISKGQGKVKSSKNKSKKKNSSSEVFDGTRPKDSYVNGGFESEASDNEDNETHL